MVCFSTFAVKVHKEEALFEHPATEVALGFHFYSPFLNASCYLMMRIVTKENSLDQLKLVALGQSKQSKNNSQTGHSQNQSWFSELQQQLRQHAQKTELRYRKPVGTAS